MSRSRIYSSLTKTEPFAGYAGKIVPCRLSHEAASAWASQILPPAFVESVDFSRGWWDAPLPEETPEEVANSFREGILPEPPVSDWRPLGPDEPWPGMAERIAASLHCTPEQLVVVPKPSLDLFAGQWAVDHLSSSGSAVALIREMHSQPRENLVTWDCAMGVFYPVSGSELDREGFADLMDLAGDDTYDLVVLTSADSLNPSVSQSLTDRDLTRLVADAQGVILGAYDGEGYIRWSRARTVQHAHPTDGRQVYASERGASAAVDALHVGQTRPIAIRAGGGGPGCVAWSQFSGSA